MKETIFAATDGLSLNVCVWDDVKSPVGAVYIAHGMAEHASRYDRFAQRLNAEGYVVYAMDERGHGKTAFILGTVEGDSFENTVEDTVMVIRHIKKTYGLPVFLLGHSYGSAMSQRFLQRYGQEVIGAILSGTSYFYGADTMFGTVAAAIGSWISGAKSPAKAIEKLSFGIYNSPFAKEGKNAWLSRDKEEVWEYNNDHDCGFTLSYGFYRSFFSGARKLYPKETPQGLTESFPIMIAVGDKDPVSANAKRAEKLRKQYVSWGLAPVMKCYAGARHEILNETNRTEVTDDFIGFINRCFQAESARNRQKE